MTCIFTITIRYSYGTVIALLGIVYEFFLNLNKYKVISFTYLFESILTNNEIENFVVC